MQCRRMMHDTNFVSTNHDDALSAPRSAETRARAGPRKTRGSPKPFANIPRCRRSRRRRFAGAENEKYFENEP
jgi:hypothetical protein